MNSLHLVAGIPSHRTPYAAKPITFHVPRFRPENFAALLPCRCRCPCPSCNVRRAEGDGKTFTFWVEA
jgi:hypothetical protein